VIEIPHLPNRGQASEMNEAKLSRRKLHMGVIPFLRHELGGRPGAPAELPSLSLGHLDVMNGGPERDASKRERVSRKDIRLRS
jgi:hypothetical protein